MAVVPQELSYVVAAINMFCFYICKCFVLKYFCIN